MHAIVHSVCSYAVVIGGVLQASAAVLAGQSSMQVHAPWCQISEVVDPVAISSSQLCTLSPCPPWMIIRSSMESSGRLRQDMTVVHFVTINLLAFILLYLRKTQVGRNVVQKQRPAHHGSLL